MNTSRTGRLSDIVIFSSLSALCLTRRTKRFHASAPLGLPTMESLVPTLLFWNAACIFLGDATSYRTLYTSMPF